MQVIGIKTRIFQPPKDNFDDVLGYIDGLQEKDIVAITSKVIAICEGRCIKTEKNNRKKIISSQVDIVKTIGIALPYNGIDESNGNGYHILLPEDAAKSAKDICEELKKKFNIEKLGVIITDSIRTGFRKYGMIALPYGEGLIGVSIGYYGFKRWSDTLGKPDLFGRNMEESATNVVDSVAIAANLVMGERNEQKPIAIVKGVEAAVFE